MIRGPVDVLKTAGLLRSLYVYNRPENHTSSELLRPNNNHNNHCHLLGTGPLSHEIPRLESYSLFSIQNHIFCTV